MLEQDHEVKRDLDIADPDCTRRARLFSLMVAASKVKGIDCALSGLSLVSLYCSLHHLDVPTYMELSINSSDAEIEAGYAFLKAVEDASGLG